MTARRSSWRRAITAGLSLAVAAGVVVAGAPAATAVPTVPTVPAGLTEFYGQQPAWTPCEPSGPLANLQCAALTVPMNYRQPGAERISVTISKLPAKDPAKRRGVLLLNPGGPGGSGIGLPNFFADRPIAQAYDLIGFDPRGVGRSTPLNCEAPPAIEGLSSRPDDAEFALWTADARAGEDGCERAAGGLRPFVNTPNTARDMDVMRGVLGEKKINYLGFSYGTYLGAVFGSLFPKSLDRNVLDSAVSPDWIWREQFKQQALAHRSNVDLLVGWLGERDGTYGLGKSAGEVFANSEALAAKLAVRPVTDPEYGEVDRTIYDVLLGSAARYRPLWDSAGEVIKRLSDAADGVIAPDSPEMVDAGKAARALYALAVPSTISGVFQTVTCEADWPKDLQIYYSDMRLYRERYPYGGGISRAAPNGCTFRSFTPPDRVTDLKRGYPTGLVIQADGDTQTQYDGGPAMAAKLRDHLISVPDDGTHGLYVSNTCVQALVDRYLVDGVLPGTTTTCAGDPRPDVPPDSAGASASARGSNNSTLQERIAKFAKNKQLDKVTF
ncbi:alpha/beta fold hydrolase [Amycolatopsis nigrescens]|uniref:alpha/beta fold hydrolase n=1 Tax=Amycolatopsis nigrescens TaxID=381445 RepID=UPI0003A38222|nr:alpha/beta fold hydrolase [Amycolatopsis nigrescens]